MKRIHERDNPAFLLPRTRGKAPEPRPKASQPEAVTQREACAFLDAHGIAWFHMPAWLLAIAFAVEKGNPDPVVREAAEEVRGLPDLLLFYRGRAAAFELKTEIGTATKAQKSWIVRLNGQVCHTLADFKRAVLAWKVSIDAPAKPTPLPDTSPNPSPCDYDPKTGTCNC